MTDVGHENFDRWFDRVKDEFGRTMQEFVGKPIHYVEVGVWSGASSEWVRDNVLTNPNSSGVGIDPYDASLVEYKSKSEKQEYQQRLDAAKHKAIERLGGSERYQLWIGTASRCLKRMQSLEDHCWVDVLYLDGRHEAPHVLSDFMLAWPLLHDGSLVIFDDFAPNKPKQFPHVNEAVAAIVLVFGANVAIEKSGAQVAMRVLGKSCDVNWLERSGTLRGVTARILGAAQIDV